MTIKGVKRYCNIVFLYYLCDIKLCFKYLGLRDAERKY